MPPRRSARVAAVEERATSALSPLPLSVVLHIFSLLPVDCRLRCSEVCRGWRSVLLERSLWTRLDLTTANGEPLAADGDAGDDETDHEEGGPYNALLRCAAARAGGHLQSLRVDGRFSHAVLLQVAAANAGALHELHASTLGFSTDEAVALLHAAPLLVELAAADVLCMDMDAPAVARRVLRSEAPFGPLRVQSLHVFFHLVEDDAGVVAFAADLTAHASLRALQLDAMHLVTAAASDAVVDAAVAARLETVSLQSCQFTTASAAHALARLLGSDALTTLVWAQTYLRLDAPAAAAALAAALRANSTLTSLKLYDAGVFFDDASGAAMLGALTGLASLQTLCLQRNHLIVPHQGAVGAALGALVAANAPSLTHLDVSGCGLHDDDLRALLAALPYNTHLRTLCVAENAMSAAFARDVLLPAVRANTSLREMETWGDPWRAEEEAARIVSLREAA
jgi:hypothetical protein